MKTAISIDDALMEEADQAAQDLGLSRSRLIADALSDYLRKRRQALISERLNQAYASNPDPAELGLIRKLKTKLSAKSKW